MKYVGSDEIQVGLELAYGGIQKFWEGEEAEGVAGRCCVKDDV